MPRLGAFAEPGCEMQIQMSVFAGLVLVLAPKRALECPHDCSGHGKCVSCGEVVGEWCSASGGAPPTSIGRSGGRGRS